MIDRDAFAVLTRFLLKLSWCADLFGIGKEVKACYSECKMPTLVRFYANECMIEMTGLSQEAGTS